MAESLDSDQRESDSAKVGEADKLHKSFKCANCAAKMEFVPGADAQECPYCGHENPIPKSEEDIKELDFRSHLARLSERVSPDDRPATPLSMSGAAAATPFARQAQARNRAVRLKKPARRGAPGCPD